MENMSHQWAFRSLDHLLPPFPVFPSPALPTSLCLIVSGCERRPGSGLPTHVSPSSLQLPCPYALTQAGRGSLACTLHLHVALPPQNNRPSNLMRLRYEEALRACRGCGCVCVVGERHLPFYC